MLNIHLNGFGLEYGRKISVPFSSLLSTDGLATRPDGENGPRAGNFTPETLLFYETAKPHQLLFLQIDVLHPGPRTNPSSQRPFPDAPCIRRRGSGRRYAATPANPGPERHTKRAEKQRGARANSKVEIGS
jgi:hypothetical protein